MLKIARFFEIQFADNDFSSAELLDFTQDHLGRLAEKNTDGRYDTMLAATGNVYEAFGGTVSNEKTAAAIGKARTKAKATHRKTIQDQLSGLSGTLHGKFGKDSVEYIEFFPQGLNEIHDAREAEIEPILDRIVQAATTHLPESVADLSSLLATWTTLYESATAGRAATTSAEQAWLESKTNLQLQLTTNLLDVAREFVGQPAMANDFFDESRLYNRQAGEGSGSNGGGTPPPGITFRFNWVQSDGSTVLLWIEMPTGLSGVIILHAQEGTVPLTRELTGVPPGQIVQSTWTDVTIDGEIDEVTLRDAEGNDLAVGVFDETLPDPGP